jgi:3-oxoacyl-[acyl-carrier-protein] synthase II
MSCLAITNYLCCFTFGGFRTTWRPGREDKEPAATDAPVFDEGGVRDLPAGVGLRLGQGPGELAPQRLAVCVGSSKGDTGSWPHILSGNRDFAAWPDGVALRVARALGSQGPVLCPVAACATGAHAQALAGQLLEDGRADAVFAGALEPPQPPLIMAAYQNMRALSTGGIARPFDKRRDGFVPASGYAWLLLETPEGAAKRGAAPLGYLTGWSMVSDATHMTAMAPEGDSVRRAVQLALKRAGEPGIDYINAHGTATRLNDVMESRALGAHFGRGVPVSSTKAATGHLLGAAGAVEAVVCLRAMENSLAPPTLNLQYPDEGCDLDYIPLRGRQMSIKHCLSLNYGFGGHIGTLVLEKA